MTTTKKIFSIIITIAMLATLLPISASSQNEYTHSADCPYEPYIPCSHAHDDACGGEENCTHEHDDICGYNIGEDCICAERVPVYVILIDTVDMDIWEGETYESADFQPFFITDTAVYVTAEDFPPSITVGDDFYVFHGIFAMPTGGDELNVTLVDSLTIPPIPTDTESEDFYTWLMNWSDGIYPIYLKHSHTAIDENQWESDAAKHWQECECGNRVNEAAHDYDDNEDTLCDICDYERHVHDFTLTFDDINHWQECECGQMALTQPHIDGADEDTFCDSCGYDVAKWKYFTFNNSTSDFFARGETTNYSLGDYADDYEKYFTQMYSTVYYDWREALYMIMDYQNDIWGGSCYGYGAVEILSNLGLLNISYYDYDVPSLPQAPAPSQTENKDVRSLLNYYWLTQFMPTTRSQSNALNTSAGKAAMLEFAEYIAGSETQNKALFSYFFREGLYTYGHAFVIDGGTKNADGSFTLTGYDNRFHGFTWRNNGEDVTVKVNVNANGTASVSIDGGYAYYNGGLYSINSFTEVIAEFEYIKADASSFALLNSLKPSDSDTAILVEGSLLPTFVLLPSSGKATETMKVSTDEYEFSVNDLIDAEEEIHPDIENSYMIVRGAMANEGEITNTPGGMMVEMNELDDNYTITEPSGTVSLNGNGRVFSLTTNSADNAAFDMTNGTMTVKNNKGEFSATVTNDSGTIAKIEGRSNGSIEIIPTEDGVELTAPAGTYEIEYTAEDGTVTEDTINIKRKSSGGGGGSTTTFFTVTFETNGGSEIQAKSVAENAVLAKPADPEKEGNTFMGWYTDQELATTYDFTARVANDFTLYAKWAADTDAPNDSQEWINPFTDVDANDWFFEDVRYANEKGLMNGTTETLFSPNANLTRAMLVTVLYRMEGEPATNRSIPFADIDMGAYYANAVIWAQQNGIVNGISDTEFAPNDNVTREQIAAIMHRYAEYKGYDVSVGENTNILSYDDFAEISEYAIAPMQYAAGSGLMNGKTESTLNPKDFATRAEIAAILHRFIVANN